MKATYIDHMGTDLSVVNAARVSFGKKSVLDCPEGEDCCQQPVGCYGKLEDADKSLIQFLARGCTSGDWREIMYDAEKAIDFEALGTLSEILDHVRRMPPHWSPFAHTAITLHLKMPIFVARQIMKHTTGFAYNEVSRRYVTDEPEFFDPEYWRMAADNVKQGSSDEKVAYVGGLTAPIKHGAHVGKCVEAYRDMLCAGVAPEQARMVLPQSMYTEVIATANLYAWSSLFLQRTDSHAQRETQDLAHQIGEIINPLYPVSWEALTK